MDRTVPTWDVAVPREGEPGYPAESAGGAASWDAMFGARFTSRVGLRYMLLMLAIWVVIAAVVFGWLIFVNHA